MLSSDRFLRIILGLDAATCVATGLLLTIGAGVITELTLIPANVFFYAGLSLFPIALFIAFIATRHVLVAPLVWLVIAGNAMWIAASLWLIFGGSTAPSTIGYAFVLVQAAAVAVLAELEFFGLRRSLPTGGAASPSRAGL
jgi:hypothetical protein